MNLLPNSRTDALRRLLAKPAQAGSPTQASSRRYQTPGYVAPLTTTELFLNNCKLKWYRVLLAVGQLTCIIGRRTSARFALLVVGPIINYVGPRQDALRDRLAQFNDVELS